MPTPINKIAIIGTGVIGSGWTLRLLAKKKEVYVFDPNLKQEKFLLDEIKRTTKSLKNFYKTSTISTKKLFLKKSIKEAVKDADLIQENGPENEKIKKKIVKEISKWSKPNAIIASSSSGLLPTKIQSACKNPARFIIAHPFNPVYLLPLVELVKGKKTKNNFIKKSEIFYRSLGMQPLIVKKEIEGYLSDRLQESMWRESLHIINENLASTDDLDKAIIHGPGLRWSLMGTFLTFHLAGGKLGMRHMLKQFGPALKLPWTKLKAPKLTKKLSNRIIKGAKKQSKGKSIKELTTIRDNFLIDLLKLKNKYKI
ncbi:MAG: L-carnitine dehydrogenase [Pelagibacteraceae bacterium]|jgi:carnitine 3-dehydrogenase|nr:L-carnitine dehydrogenase [Pelagibacteraceae bacterium]MBO6467522.1 L-carnitine dehydrogenase [Pelagibacteraceae bacterium]MBO6480029.1 L-carnitine dehydrogenase [Pelagibacteraceae bacterium]